MYLDEIQDLKNHNKFEKKAMIDIKKIKEMRGLINIDKHGNIIAID